MPTYALSIGLVTPIIQNVVYALPAKAAIVTTDVALEQSVSSTGPWVALTSGSTTAASFVRCPTGNANVTLKRCG